MTYALPIWLPKVRNEGQRSLNALFTKFLKRYRGVPWGTRNGFVHYVTGTSPIFECLQSKALKAFLNINYPPSMNGVSLPPPPEQTGTYRAIEHVPSFFWMYPVMRFPLPSKPEVRTALLYDAFDLHHHKLCPRKNHHEPSIVFYIRRR